MIHSLKKMLSLALVSGLLLSSCVKTDFDEPDLPNPCDIQSGLTPNITVQGIGTLFASLPLVQGSTTVHQFPDSNIVLEAIVVSNDASGNIYKSLYLEDATGAVMLSIEGSDLYNDYPQGQKVHLNLANMTVEFDTWVSIHEIGYGTYVEGSVIKGIGRIPVTILPNLLKNHSCKTTPTPTVLDLAGINVANMGRLVTFNNVQIIAADTAKTYADAVSDPPASVSIMLEDCNGTQIIMRNSGYASFAGFNVPNGKGSVTGILTKYGSDYQILLNDTSGVQLNGSRCGSGGGTGTGTGTFADPFDVEHAMSDNTGTGVWVQGFIVGTVVNVNPDPIYSDFTAPFTVNTNVYIAASAGETDTTKMLSIKLKTGSEARAATNLMDNVGLLGKEVKYYGNLGAYNGIPGMLEPTGYWIIETNTGVNPVDPSTIWSEDFSYIADPYLPITSMTVVMQAGTKDWHGDGYNGQSAEVSAYGSGEASNIAWLITPVIDLTTATSPKLSFYSALKYSAGDLLTVWISTNYDGGSSPQNATWIELSTANIVTSSDPVDASSGYNFTNSGDVDLSAYNTFSTVYIAWKYVGSGTNSLTTKYRVDNILIKN